MRGRNPVKYNTDAGCGGEAAAVCSEMMVSRLNLESYLRFY